MRRQLTWDKEQNACSKGFIKPVKGGVMDKSHNTDDDANKAGQQRQDHECSCSIPVCCKHIHKNKSEGQCSMKIDCRLFVNAQLSLNC